MLSYSNKGKNDAKDTPFLLKDNFIRREKSNQNPKPKKSSNHFYYGKKGILDTLE